MGLCRESPPAEWPPNGVGFAEAAFFVEGVDEYGGRYGGGVLGWCAREIDARRAVKFFRNMGVTRLAMHPVEDLPRGGGLHRLAGEGTLWR